MEDVHKQRILEVARVVESQIHSHPESNSGFNMLAWTHPCGTPSCIWGWAEAVRSGTRRPDIAVTTVETGAWMGLTEDQLDELFVPTLCGGLLSVTPAQAGETLRKLAETGKVDWTHVDPDYTATVEED